MILRLMLFLVMIAMTVTAPPELDIRANSPPIAFDGHCFCAMFRNEDDPKWVEPLLISVPQIPIPHTVIGARSCLRICIALFVASEDGIGKALCKAVKTNEEDLRVTVHFRLCEEENWASTRNTNANPVCCKEGEYVKCKPSKKE